MTEKKKKKPRPFNLKTKIKSALRTVSVFWPPKKEARDRYKVYVEDGLFKNGNPKMKAKYRCESCSQLFNIEETQMDHKEPVDPLTGFVDWNTYIDRLFVEADGYSCLCNDCHTKKTQEENQIRKENRKLKKKKS